MVRQRTTIRSAVTAVATLATGLLLSAAPAHATLSGVGPDDPATGLPTYYQDDTGQRLDACLTDTVNCVTATTVPDPTSPPSVWTSPPNLAPEEFYYAADAKMTMPGGGQALITVGLQNGWTSTTQCGKSPCPAPGKQAIFGRVRFRIDGLTPGLDYTIRYPWGSQVVTPTTSGTRSVNLTIDTGCAATAGALPCDPTLAEQAVVGPFLGWDPAVAPAAPAGFLGSYALLHTITGSRVLDDAGQPQNYFSVEGPDLPKISTDLFSVAGEIARPAVVDTTPPSVPQGLTATATGTGTVQLAWQPATDPQNQPVTYRVYRDGVALPGAPTAGTTLTDSGLQAGTTYRYEVTALDPTGNESARSAAASATTAVQPQPAPPVPPSAPGAVTAALPAGSILGAATVPVQLSWGASSPAADVTGYDLAVTSPDGGSTVTATPGGTSSTVSLAPGHQYTVSVRSRSAAGLSTATSTSFSAALAQETDRSVTYSKNWARKKVPTASGGQTEVTSTGGSTATVRFTGTDLAWVATPGPGAATATVTLDGGAPTTVNLSAPTTTTRKLVLIRSGLASGNHTLTITLPAASTGKGKAARSVDLDAVATLTAP